MPSCCAAKVLEAHTHSKHGLPSGLFSVQVSRAIVIERSYNRAVVTNKSSFGRLIDLIIAGFLSTA